MKRKRILLVASYNRSILLFRKDLLLAFKAAGYEVLAVAPNDHPHVADELKNLGIAFMTTPMSRTGFNPVSDFFYLMRLIRIIREFKPNVIFPYTIKPVIYAGIASRFFKDVRLYPLITGLGYLETENESNRKGAVKRLIFKLYRAALVRAAGILFQNRDDRAYFYDNRLVSAELPFRVVNGSGVNMSEFSRTPPVIAPVRFILVARLIRSKGVALYINAAARLKVKFPDSEFHLIGQFDEHNPDSIDQKWLIRMVDEGAIVFHGFQNDVRKFLAMSSVFVLPSWYREGVPRTILEAMAMGRAVITTDNTGCRETVVEGRNGYLIPVKDEDALVNAMQTFLDDPPKIERMGAAAYEVACSRFDVKKVNADIFEFMKIT